MMENSIKIHKGMSLDLRLFIENLVKSGYSRKEGIAEEGDFMQKGDNIIIFPSTFEYPLRIELTHSTLLRGNPEQASMQERAEGLTNDTVDRIVSIDAVNFRAIQEHDTAIILPLSKTRVHRKKLWQETDPIEVFVDIEPNGYVVHIDHGIGKYIGIRRIGAAPGLNTEEECAAVEYKDGDILYVPLSDFNKIQKYIYFNKKKPELHKLGNKKWKQEKERAARGVYKVALDILDIQAKRESLGGYKFSEDTDWQKEMEAQFPYKETHDQILAAGAVKKDMETAMPMDRLLCGDVGYGKTEVALRAAFKAVMDNKQTAILVPTTILAEQHLNTFSDRLKAFPVKIEMLSRFRSKKEQKEIIEGIKNGSVDIIIGTHRLLSNDISFKDLGLVIIDEEQRFGVAHKEKLKKMRLIVDVLTLTATPIPRTLYLALMGGRDISTINTPPLERQPIDTNIIEFDERILKTAIEYEMQRKGQVFLVHNRIDTIDRVAKRVKKLLPDLRMAIGHGKMSEHELEKTMMSFIKGEIDVLISTTIIESGIDIPNANTIIIDRAETFGLADLYQLRGRVGRFNRQAYAYFIVGNIKTLTEDEQRRLESIKKMAQLGSGFKLAMQDLEMRGAGNILGVQQHGFIENVGFDLYCRLLRRAIRDLKIENAANA